MKGICLTIIAILSFLLANGQWSNTGFNYTTDRLAIGTSSWTGKRLNVQANDADHMTLIENSHASGYGMYLRAANDPLRIVPFSGSGNHLFVVNGNGNVGIGTTSPSNRLHVNFDNGALDFNQALRIQTNFNEYAVGRGGGMIMENADVITAGIFGIRQNNNWEGALSFYTHTGTSGNTFGSSFTEKMRITSDGNVGIGVSTPSQPLDVIGRLKFRAKDSGTAGVWFTGNDGTENLFVGQTGTSSSDPFGIYHGNWRLVVTQNGDMGLGVMAPSQRLDVVGRLKFRATASATAGVWFSDATGAETAFLGNVGFSSSDALGIYHGGTWRFVVSQNGNVGIGTINPDARLAVKGIIHTEEVRVDLNVPAPDYVFEKDYDLLSLTELETYINQNKHLPEVPSAKEMEANGLNLKEMNLLLLKKVEELTLHLIEQNKEIKSLKEQVQKIKP